MCLPRCATTGRDRCPCVRIPIRPRGNDPRMPEPGDGSRDWRGFLDPRAWPSVIDPAQGWLESVCV